MTDTIEAHNDICINARIVLEQSRSAQIDAHAGYMASVSVLKFRRAAYIKMLDARDKFLQDSTKDKS